MTPDNLHKRLLDNLKTGVVVMDRELRLLSLNVAAENLMEISVRKANRLFIGDVFIKAAEDIGEMQTALNNNSSFTKRQARLQLKSLLTAHTRLRESWFADWHMRSRTRWAVSEARHSC